MANQIVQLYDLDSQPIDPKSTASAIYGGVTVPGNSTVYDDLTSILSQLLELRRWVSGAEEVENKLSIQVFYSTNIHDKESDAKNDPYTETFQIPTASAPYTWKQTIFKWGQEVVGRTYEIIATALYPETQVMYAVTTLVNSSDITGPADYTTDTSGIADKNSEVTVRWYDHFKGINPSQTMGFMATRHREAGKSWPQDGGWHVALFAVYPTN